jgi:predicted ribosomally synthesized peptide with SipW-like signal peptide
MMKRGRHRDPRQAERAKAVVTLASALAVGLVASGATWSAFNAQTQNSANTFTAGTVTLTDNDTGTYMFNVSNLKPGNPVSRCIRVDYTGSLPVSVKLYGTQVSTTGLEQYLQLTVTRGTGPSGTPWSDCTSFAADAVGTIYSGLMSALPADQATGVSDGTTWAAGESHWYRFTVDVADNQAAQGKSVTETFTWDAR